MQNICTAAPQLSFEMHRREWIFVAIGQAHRSKHHDSVVCFADVRMRSSVLADERYGERLAFRWFTAPGAVDGRRLSGPGLRRAADCKRQDHAQGVVFVMGRSKPFHRMNRSERAIFRRRVITRQLTRGSTAVTLRETCSVPIVMTPPRLAAV